MSLARKEPGVIQSLSLEFGSLRFGMRYLAQVKREWRFKQVSLLVYTAAGLFGSSSGYQFRIAVDSLELVVV